MSLLNNSSDDQTVDHKIAPDVLDIEKLIKQNQIKDKALKKATQLIELLKQQIEGQRNSHQESLEDLQRTLRCQYQIQIEQHKSRNQFLERQLNRLGSTGKDQRVSSAKKIVGSNINLSRASSIQSLSKSKEKAARIASSRIFREIEREEHKSNTYHNNFLQLPFSSSKNINQRMKTSSSGQKSLFQKFSIEKDYCKQLLQDYQIRQNALINALTDLFNQQTEEVLNVKNNFSIIKEECQGFIAQNQSATFKVSSKSIQKRNDLQRNQVQTRSNMTVYNISRSNVSQNKFESEVTEVLDREIQKINELLSIIKKQERIIQDMKRYQKQLQEIVKILMHQCRDIQKFESQTRQYQDEQFISTQSTSFSKSNFTSQAWTSTSPPSSQLYQYSQISRPKNIFTKQYRKSAANQTVQWLEFIQRKVKESLKKHKRQIVEGIKDQNRQLKNILDQIVQIVKAQNGVSFDFIGTEKYQIRTGKRINPFGYKS